MEMTTPVEENLPKEFSFNEVLQDLRLSSSEKSYIAPQLPDDIIMKYEEELDNLVELTTKNSIQENNLEDMKGNNSSDCEEESSDTLYFSFENSSKEESDVDETETPDPRVDFKKLFEEQKERHVK
ncbi:hypothetical protein GCK72_018915 [Caenorhabditis remanei]|uniref:Uncharacterized protein n=1 Tax=Caenorhabditis remanei TaxID=31234 RepID=A0A6A5GCB0_CAERE|nr:hypothetical protein GCK72_018915 [Caenorhabditis remanei]KAF1752361.1 hypothetical protein GCK72_018915 [Caenorhabditis remanei]